MNVTPPAGNAVVNAIVWIVKIYRSKNKMNMILEKLQSRKSRFSRKEIIEGQLGKPEFPSLFWFLKML